MHDEKIAYRELESGSHIHLVPVDINIHPNKLSVFIQENRLNQWFSVPSALSYLAKFQVIPDGGYPDLKVTSGFFEQTVTYLPLHNGENV